MTIIVDDIGETARAYGEAFGYRDLERRAVSASEAETWDCPAMEGAPLLLMQPESGADFALRFVEAEPTEGYAALQTHGWNAAELLVQDPDAMAERLAASTFEVIGMPYDLGGNPNARAMQVQGPSGEILYLTRLKGDYAEFFGTANCPVDRGFIMVAGGPDHDAMKRFYADLGQEIVGESDFPITVLSRALGLPRETRYPLSSARLARSYSFELDGYPEQTRARPRRYGELPPGIAMVSVAVNNLDAIDLEWRSPPKPITHAPYNGRRAAVAIGAAGEWLECVDGGETK
ncbi:hypothetical protein ACEWMW_07415 [Altererythrobacter sp. MF3-039]